MRFLRHKKHEPQPELSTSREEPTRDEALAALRESEERLVDVRSRTPEVEATASSLALTRIQNHFTEKLIVAFGGKP